MLQGVADKTVAIVGRAASLGGSGNGAAIDGCDVVVRVNWALPLVGEPADIGSRTDVLYHCVSCNKQVAMAEASGVATQRVNTKLRKKLAKRSGMSHVRWRPTTGAVAIDDALMSGAVKVCAFGMDIYRTGYVAPTPPSESGPTKWRHSAKQDRRLLRALLKNKRFEPDAILRQALR